MKLILVQAKKEWIEFRRDKLSLALAFLLPLFTLLLFGFGIKLESKNIKMVVRDYDNTAVSRKYIDDVFSTALFERVDSKRPETNNEDPAYELNRGLARVALTIPKDFTARVFRGEPASYSVLIDGTDISNAQVIYNAIGLINERLSKKLSEQRLDGVRVARVKPDIAMLFNPNRKEADFIVPGTFGVILWMFPALLSAVCAAREKELGTLTRAISCDTDFMVVVLGKALVYFGVGMMMALLIFCTGTLLFDFGSSTALLPLILTVPLYVLTSVLFGISLGISASSQTNAVQATSTLGFFPCLLLSGFVYPIANIPFPISLLSYLVPARYFIELCRNAMVREASLATTWQAPATLGLFVLILLYLNWRYTRRMKYVA